MKIKVLNNIHRHISSQMLEESFGNMEITDFFTEQPATNDKRV